MLCIFNTTNYIHAGKTNTQASKASAEDKFNGMTFASFAATVGWALTMMAVFRIINYVVATYLLQLELPERKAVVISASQKTLPIAITVLGFLPPAVGEEGVMAIACIIAQLTQILVDSLLIGMYPGWDDGDSGGDAKQDGGGGGGGDAKQDGGESVNPQRSEDCVHDDDSDGDGNGVELGELSDVSGGRTNSRSRVGIPNIPPDGGGRRLYLDGGINAQRPHLRRIHFADATKNAKVTDV